MTSTVKLKDGIAENKITRRALHKILASAGIATVMVPLLPGGARAASQPMYFTWGGYDIPEIHGKFIDQHGAPEFSLFGEEEEALQKLRAGFRPDVAHPCSYNTELWRDAGVIQPIDTDRLTNWPDIIPMLQDLPGTQFDGQQWFVPFDWGQSSILYRTDLVDIEEESWDLLWDERYAGRMAAMDILEDIIPLGALRIGVDPFNFAEDDIPKIREALVEQRKLLRFYSSDMTSVEQALVSGELVAAMTWNSSFVSLSDQGLPVRFMEPKEGALTWVCGMVLVDGAPSYDLAHELIDSMIDPSAGAFLINDYGYGHSNERSFDLISDERLAELGLSRDPVPMLQGGIFLEQLPYRDQLARMFSEVQSGY